MPDDTTEAREVAERFRPFFGNWMRGQTPMHEWLASEIADALAAARQSAIEEAARVADALEDEWHEEWRKGHKADRYLEGMSDGADVVADAIRQLGISGEDAK